MKQQMMTGIIFFLVLSSIIVVQQGWSQDSPDVEQSVGVDVSIGFAGLQNLGVNLGGELFWQSEHDLLTLQFQYSREIQLQVFFIPGSAITPYEQTLTYSIMYGQISSFHMERMLSPLFPIALLFKREVDYTFSASFGCSFINNHRRSNTLQQTQSIFSGEGENDKIFVEDNSINFGLPVQMELVQIISPDVGYVHRLYCNFSKLKPLWGFQWGVQVYF